MELIWLEDFVALAETGNFSRAAEARHVTQPAFSRRIRTLEDWLGAPLFDRTPQGVTLTAAGELFRPGAEEIIRRAQQLRREAREAVGREAGALRFAATHALSFTFFPGWIRALEARQALGAIRLISDSMQACEQLMLQGQAQFLLCHFHEAAPARFEPRQFRSAQVGEDVLVPLCAPDDAGAPLWRLDLDGEPAPHLAYSAESGLGRIRRAEQARRGRHVALKEVFSAHLAATLLSMARDGRGIAWVPLTLAAADLEEGRVVRAGAEDWDVPVEIRLFRPTARQSPAAEKLWEMVAA